MLSDVRYGIRQHFRNPGATLVVLATLSLLVGALTLGVTAYQAEASANSPFPNAERLVRLWQANADPPSAALPARLYAEMRARLRGLETMGAFVNHQAFVLGSPGESLSVTGAVATAAVFEIMDIKAEKGRTFSEDEVRRGYSQVAVITHELWQGQFNGDESAIGSNITLNESTYTIIGVMPKTGSENLLFRGIDLWIPRNFDSPAHGAETVEIIGRLTPGTSLNGLRAEVRGLLPSLIPMLPQGWRDAMTPSTDVAPFPIDTTFSQVDAGEIILILLIVALPLLIACANLTNILLARIELRRREFAVRSSLGGRRQQVGRQVMMECMLLGLIAVPGGFLLALWARQYAAQAGVPTEWKPQMVVAIIFCACALGGIIGLLPAWRASHVNLSADLKEGGMHGGRSRHRLRMVLIGAQMMMATVLYITAGLLLRSYLNRLQFDPGFDASRFVQISVSLRTKPYEVAETRMLFVSQAMDRLAAVPGVEKVGFATASPIVRTSLFKLGVNLRSDQPGPTTTQRTANVQVASPSLLPMTGARLLRGRWLEASDRRGGPAVAVVTASFAEEFFPGVDPIGQTFAMTVEEKEEWITVVGVVSDRRNLGIREDLGPEVCLSATQFCPSWTMYFIVQTPLGESLAAALRDAVRSVDPAEPVSQARGLESIRLETVERFLAPTRIISAIAVFGLIMAIIGLYGVVARSVVERTHEIGVRMAMGARRQTVLNLLVRQNMKPVMLGLSIGLVLAVVCSHLLNEIYFGVSGADPATYGSVSGLLLGTALLATTISTLRTATIDPMVALRSE